MIKLFFIRPKEITVHLEEEVGKYLILTVCHSRKYERTITMYGVPQGKYDGVPFEPDISLGVLPPDDWHEDEIPMIHMLLGPYDKFYFERRNKDTEELIFIPKPSGQISLCDRLGASGASSDVGYNRNIWPEIKDGTLWTLGK
jgi:hypothetical protein